MSRSNIINLTPSYKCTVSGHWRTPCDGMPSPTGCSEEAITPVPYTRVGLKNSGWLISWGLDLDGREDKSVILAFCPKCTATVKEQER